MSKQATLLTGAMSAVILSAMLAFPSPATADDRYAWCAQYSGRDGGGGTNCGFTTRAQCQMTITGMGGWCVQNPRYVSNTRDEPRRSNRPRY